MQALLQLVPGVHAYFFSCHLTAFPYGPFMLRDGIRPRNVQRAANALQLRDMRIVMSKVYDVSTEVQQVPLIVHVVTTHRDWAGVARFVAHAMPLCCECMAQR